MCRSGRIHGHEVAARVLEREQSVGEREQRSRLGAHPVLPVEQRDLVLQVVVQQDVVRASLEVQSVEVEFAEPGAPRGGKVAHATALVR